jgi:diaminopimelate decarboxylase
VNGYTEYSMKSIGRPPAFPYKGATLYADALPIHELAEIYGTPLYVYSLSALRERFAMFNHAFQKVPHTVCYAVKANSNIHVLRDLAKLGAGFDIVSSGELERVRKAFKTALSRTVFSGVGKTADEMDAALKAGILMFNVESEGELKLLAARAVTNKVKTPMAMRVNPDVFARTHPYISTGLREHKFGVSLKDAARLYAFAADQKWLQPVGVSVHIGSQITDVQPFAAALKRVGQLVKELRANGHNIRYVDAGGGLGIGYKDADAARIDFAKHTAQYANAIISSLRGLNVHLLLEPGRALIAPCGALLTRVLYVKQNGRKRFVIVDAGMNDLIRPALYSAHHGIIPAKKLKSGRTAIYDIVGPVCETGDFFARDRRLPVMEENDLLCILDTGAYGMSLSSNYNSRGRAAEVLVQGNAVMLARKRETIQDQMKNEMR